MIEKAKSVIRIMCGMHDLDQGRVVCVCVVGGTGKTSLRKWPKVVMPPQDCVGVTRQRRGRARVAEAWWTRGARPRRALETMLKIGDFILHTKKTPHSFKERVTWPALPFETHFHFYLLLSQFGTKLIQSTQQTSTIKLHPSPSFTLRSGLQSSKWEKDWRR